VYETKKGAKGKKEKSPLVHDCRNKSKKQKRPSVLKRERLARKLTRYAYERGQGKTTILREKGEIPHGGREGKWVDGAFKRAGIEGGTGLGQEGEVVGRCCDSPQKRHNHTGAKWAGEKGPQGRGGGEQKPGGARGNRRITSPLGSGFATDGAEQTAIASKKGLGKKNGQGYRRVAFDLGSVRRPEPCDTLVQKNPVDERTGTSGQTAIEKRVGEDGEDYFAKRERISIESRQSKENDEGEEMPRL